MAHHSSGPSPELDRLLGFAHRGQDAQAAADAAIEASVKKIRELKASVPETEKLGATGRFPEGKLVDEDEGEIRISIGTAKGSVVLDFGKPTAWVGMTPDQAIDLGNTLIKHAEAVRAG